MAINRKIFSLAGLILYICLLFFVLTLYRLPADKLVAATLENLSEGKLLFKAGKMSPMFPDGYKMEDIFYGILVGDTMLTDNLESLTICPSYRGLFAGYFPVIFEGSMPKGIFQGKIGVSIINRMEKGYLSIKTFDLLLEDMDILTPLIKRELKGKLNGEMKIKGNLADFSEIDGEGYLSVDDGSIETRIGLPGMESVPFDSIKLAFSLENGRVALRDSEMNGPMLSGKMSGAIDLKKKIFLSRLKLEAKMNPGPALVNNPLAGRFLSKIRRGNNPFIIKIGGTLSSPSIRWSKS
jgi:type II secretion system protein N